MSKTRILVVDDEASARSGLEKLLNQAGYEVTTAADGAIALDLAAEHAPDLVLTDLNMPNLDGMSLLSKLRAQDASLPVIVTTAFGNVDEAVEAMRKGAADFITKPLTIPAARIILKERLITSLAGCSCISCITCRTANTAFFHCIPGICCS